MRARAPLFVLALLLFLLPAPVFALDEPCAACNMVFLQPDFDYSSSTISVHASYISLSYFNQIQHVASREQDFTSPEAIDIPPDAINTALNAQIKPLANAKISFMLESLEIVDESNQLACADLATDENGDVSCPLLYYRDAQGGAQPTGSLPRCMNVLISYDGFSDGATYQPAQATVLVCGKQNSILNAIGMEITNQIEANRDVCVPIFIVLGLLLAAMYYSGKNPLSLFDITTPRLPATRKFRMARTGVMVGFTEKNVIAGRIVAHAQKAMAAMLAREIASTVRHGSAARTLSRAEQKKLMADVKKTLESTGSADEKHQQITRMLASKGVDLKKNKRLEMALRQLLFTHDAVVTDKKAQDLARGKDWATESIGKQAAKLASSKTLKKIPIVNYLVGNAAIITSQNLRSHAAAVKTRREAIGGFSATTIERLNLSRGVKKDTWLGNKMAAFLAKYSIEDKKMTVFEDPRYKIAERALHLQDELRKEEIRKLVYALFGNEIAHADKNGERWVLNSGISNLSQDKQNRVLELLQQLHRQQSGKEAEKEHYAQIINQLKGYSSVKHAADLGAIVSNLHYLNEAAKDLYALHTDKLTGKTRLASILEITQTITKDGKMETFIEHLNALDPQRAKEILDKFEAHLRNSPDSRLGTSIVYRTLEDMASGKYGSKEESTRAAASMDAQAARAWLLTLAKSSLAQGAEPSSAAEYAKKIRDLETLSQLKGEGFVKSLRAWLEANPIAKAKLHEMDQWDLRRVFDALAPNQKNNDQLLKPLGLLWKALESEHMQRQFLNEVLGGKSFSEIKAVAANMGEFNPMRMSFERALGRTQMKTAVEAEWALWEINRVQGRIETETGANLFSYHDRHYERMTNTLQWLNNWWLANIKEGQKALTSGTQRNMTAQEYTDLMKRSVLYKDLRNGIWISTSDFRVTPYALLGYKELRDADPTLSAEGKLSFANRDKLAEGWQKLWKTSYVPVLSESERLLNVHLLVNKGQQGQEDWRKSNPYNDKEATALLGDSGIGGKLRKGQTDMASHAHEKLMLVSKDMFLESDRFKTRSGASKIKDIAVHHVGGYLEAAALASTYHNSRRLQDWFVAQAAQRAVNEDFERTYKRDNPEIAITQQMHDYRVARKNRDDALNALNEAKNAGTGSLASLRHAVKTAEENLRLAAKELGPAEKEVYKLNKQQWDYWQATERASMRDPRVAHSGIVAAPALAAGYHTGQWIYEPAESVFGFGVLPGQDVLRTLYRIPYRALYTFASHTRPLFSMASGYPVRSDIHEGPPGQQRFRMREYLSSPFRFNVDWFAAQWNKPRLRSSEEYTSPLQYHSFMGINIKESHGTQARYLSPITMRSPNTTPESEAAFTTKMLRKGWTNDEIEAYKGKQDYALGATYERQMKRIQSDENYQEPWYTKGPLRPFFSQTYYTATKRTGDAYIAHGESMRDYEFYSTIYRNMGKAFPPGMMYQDWEGRQRVAPRLANYMLHMSSESPRMAALLSSSIQHSSSTESYYAMMARDANKEIFVRGSNAIALAADRDNELRRFSMWNFPASMMALSPGFALLYTLGIKKAITNMATFDTLMPHQKNPNAPKFALRALNFVKNTAISTVHPAFYDTEVNCSHCGFVIQRGTTCPNCRQRLEHDITLRNSMQRMGRASKTMRSLSKEYLKYFM